MLTVEFNPQDSGSIITSGKSHVYFWTWSGTALTKKQGIFGVSRGVPRRGEGLKLGEGDPPFIPPPLFFPFFRSTKNPNSSSASSSTPPATC